MRIQKKSVFRTPKGKVLLMMAILLPAIMGIMGLSADLAFIAASQAQLQVVTDSACLAGAMQLAGDDRVAGGTSSQQNRTSTTISTTQNTDMSNAMAMAKYVAQANRVLSSMPVINDNSSNSASGDVVIGYVDPRTKQWVAPPLSNPNQMNAVMVNASRSPTHGGVVPGFFSRVWSYLGTSVSSQSIACAQNYPILGVRTVKQYRPPVLPIVLDSQTYQLMMDGLTTDVYSYNEATQTVSDGPDGITESKLFPVATGLPGNWGAINIGVDSSSTKVQADQIQNGLTTDQLAYYGGSLRLMLSSSPDAPPSITFSGNPGISAGLQSALQSIIGRPSILPIYDQASGNGSNASYRVIGFQAVRIMAIDFRGNPKFLVVQPCLIREPTAIANTDTSTWPSNWSWQSGGVVKVHLAE